MYFRLFLSVVLALFANSLWAGESAQVAFTAGDVTVGGRSVSQGDRVREGELLTTGSDGYLYLKTVDNGFFILRPNSAGQIVTYQIDLENPANTSIKLELKNGVARHISGDAVKSARRNFRLNTPVAAVGVRGTDFTVFADQENTRIAVLSGGVVVSPFSGTCMASGFGPCEGPASRELFAGKMGQTIQVKQGQVPVLLQGVDQAPDVTSPPRSDEPAGTKSSSRGGASKTTDNFNQDLKLEPIKAVALSQSIEQLPVVGPAAPPVEHVIPPVESATPQLIWGRWQAIIGSPVDVDVAALQAANELIAINDHYAVMRPRETAWQPPVQTTLGFSLQQSQAVVLDEVSRQLTTAAIENGQLQIDFAKSSFFTKFDLLSQNQRFQLQNKGEVSSDGKLYGGNQYLAPNNMYVRGALASDNNTAAYLFQARLDGHQFASGVTSWGK